MLCVAINFLHSGIQSENTFKLTLEIGDTLFELPVEQYDTAYNLAYKFCTQQQWDLTFVLPIAQKIQTCLDSIKLLKSATEQNDPFKQPLSSLAKPDEKAG